MPKIEFAKMHGTGNDFVVIADFEESINIDEKVVRSLCDRNFGVGADGVIRIAQREGNYFMDYRNSDGSTAAMCGNGVRVVGKWLGDRNLAGNEINVGTLSGVKTLQLRRGGNGKVESVRVDMGPPQVAAESVTVETSVGKRDVVTVSMGNQHAVTFLESIDQLKDLDVATLGAAIEESPYFTDGTNAEFAVVEKGAALVRTWERGAGETLACGSGACAVAVAAVHKFGLQVDDAAGDNTQSSQESGSQSFRVEVLGGILQVDWKPGESVFMTGPAVEVFRGMMDLETPLPKL